MKYVIKERLVDFKRKTSVVDKRSYTSDLLRRFINYIIPRAS
jgi:hypothetical protein